MILTTGRLSVGEFIALYEQAYEAVSLAARDVGREMPGGRSDEVIFEFGRRVEERVRKGVKMSHSVDQFAAVHAKKEGELHVDWDKVRKKATSGPKEERQLAEALLAMGRLVEELEEEISVWRSFMVPEPVRGQRWRREVKEAAQEPVHASREEIRRAVQEVSREICGNG